MPAAMPMTTRIFRIYDPLRAEWVAPIPSVKPMTENPAEAAHFNSEAAAVMRGRQLSGPERPWLTFQWKDIATSNGNTCGGNR